MIKLDTIIVNDTIPVQIVKHSITTLEYFSDPGTIIAIIAIIISVFGVIFSVIYNRKTIKLSIAHNRQSIISNNNTLEKSIEHNKLSVKPLITHDQENIGLNHTYNILNNGLGPALLNSVRFYYERKGYRILRELIKDKRIDIYKLIDVKNSKSTVIGPGTPIMSNGKAHCHTFNFTERPKGMKEFLKKVTIIVEYSDMYGETYKFDTELQ